MAEITRKQLAEILGSSEGTIRKYERVFANWLKTPPGQKGRPIAKKYVDEDVRTLSVIDAMRKSGVSYADMSEGALDEALASGEYEVEREESASQQEESTALDVVPIREYALVVGQLQATEREHERLLEELKEERQAKEDAIGRAAAATAVAEERDRLLERLDKLEEKLDVSQEELQSERAKSWWDKVRGR